jgi:hypothetical protein
LETTCSQSLFNSSLIELNWIVSAIYNNNNLSIIHKMIKNYNYFLRKLILILILM